MSDFAVVIPARYASTRLPGKPLRLIGDRPMLEHAWHRARESGAQEILIATDDERIAVAAEAFGATVCMTRDTHRSGTDRIAEVADLLDWPDDTIVVNLQGDEPAMPPTLLEQCAALLDDPAVDIGTLASPIQTDRDFGDPNVVKVVCDRAGNALYFSRAAIPYARRQSDNRRARDAALHHHGLYAYRCGVLRTLVNSNPAPPEVLEQLEQLRALYLGMRIRVAQPADRPGRGVDTVEDLEAAARDLGL